MMNLKNYIIKIFRNKIKIYGEKKVNELTEKVSNQDIFFNKSKESKDSTFTRSQIKELKK